MFYFKKILLLFAIIFLPNIAKSEFSQPVINSLQICKAMNTITTPDSRFIINNNGTVNDKQTGLMWKRCSEGQNNIDCSGSAINYTWKNALQQANSVNNNGGFAGYNDWRIPNAKELFSIVEDQCYLPSINVKIFPNTPNYYFWSSTSNSNISNAVFYVFFGNGSSAMLTKDSGLGVRLVR
jgi:hypothetical protein